MNRIETKRPAGYEEDFALWSAEQAALLRAGQFDRVDQQHIAEEIEDLGESQRSEIESRMSVLLAHLLKWQFQPEARSNRWLATIVEQRTRIARRIKKSPSLRSYPALVLGEEYPVARLHAAGETERPLSLFPETCPYTIEQVLDPDFFPGGE